MRRIAEGIAASMGARAELDFRVEFLPLVNDEEQTAFAADCAATLVGEDNIERNRERILASEDFSYMLAMRPGAYINIGKGAGEEVCMVHNPGYDFNDEILPLGAAYFATLVEAKLAKG